MKRNEPMRMKTLLQRMEQAESGPATKMQDLLQETLLLEWVDDAQLRVLDLPKTPDAPFREFARLDSLTPDQRDLSLLLAWREMHVRSGFELDLDADELPDHLAAGLWEILSESRNDCQRLIRVESLAPDPFFESIRIGEAEMIVADRVYNRSDRKNPRYGFHKLMITSKNRAIQRVCEVITESSLHHCKLSCWTRSTTGWTLDVESAVTSDPAKGQRILDRFLGSSLPRIDALPLAQQPAEVID